MKNERVEKIIRQVKKWIKEVEEKYAGAISVEILIEKEDVYRVIFDLELCMAQLLIDTPFFALIKMFRLRWLRLKIKK